MGAVYLVGILQSICIWLNGYLCVSPRVFTQGSVSEVVTWIRIDGGADIKYRDMY